MTKHQFDTHGFTISTKIKYLGKEYYLLGVDFEAGVLEISKTNPKSNTQNENIDRRSVLYYVRDIVEQNAKTTPKLQYKDIKSESPQIRCIEFQSIFSGKLYLDFDSVDNNGMIETTCIIDTPNGQYKSVLKLNTELLNKNEADAFEAIVSVCVEHYEKAIQ